MTVYFPTIHDPILKRLFQCQMSDEQIAERMDMSWHTIRRNRQRLELGQPKPKGAHARPPSDLVPKLAPEPTSPVQIAKRVLGHRFSERNGCYLVDGVPTKTDQMVREANRKLLADGKTQFGPDNWRVKP